MPQGSILVPVLYLLYSCEILQLITYQPYSRTMLPQWQLEIILGNKLKNYTQLFIKNKGGPNFRIEKIPKIINGQRISQANQAKCLGMALDTSLRWKPHIKNKKEVTKPNSKFHQTPNKSKERLYNDIKTKYREVCQMLLGTSEPASSTRTWKWKL